MRARYARTHLPLHPRTSLPPPTRRVFMSPALPAHSFHWRSSRPIHIVPVSYCTLLRGRRAALQFPCTRPRSSSIFAYITIQLAIAIVPINDASRSIAEDRVGTGACEQTRFDLPCGHIEFLYLFSVPPPKRDQWAGCSCGGGRGILCVSNGHRYSLVSIRCRCGSSRCRCICLRIFVRLRSANLVPLVASCRLSCGRADGSIFRCVTHVRTRARGRDHGTAGPSAHTNRYVDVESASNVCHHIDLTWLTLTLAARCHCCVPGQMIPLCRRVWCACMIFIRLTPCSAPSVPRPVSAYLRLQQFEFVRRSGRVNPRRPRPTPHSMHRITICLHRSMRIRMHRVSPPRVHLLRPSSRMPM
jgi:hypothetical protein